MSQSRLEERVGKVTRVGTSRTSRYKLMFNAGRGFANMVMTGIDEDFIEGVVYELTPKQFKKLDQFEGYPFFYQKIVLRHITKPMLAYISINPMYTTERSSDPHFDYMRHMLDGAKTNDLVDTLRILSTIKCRMRE
jgi:gamma-glutamylcyclotransferase (GGCT)/AIG2-like uncharacterized protein YtfP